MPIFSCYLLSILQLLLTTDFMPSSSFLTLKHVTVCLCFSHLKKKNPFFYPIPLSSYSSISSLYSQSSWESFLSCHLYFLLSHSLFNPLYTHSSPEIAPANHTFLVVNSNGYKSAFLGHQTCLTICPSWSTPQLPPVRVISSPGLPHSLAALFLYIPLPLLYIFLFLCPSLVSAALPSPGLSNPFCGSTSIKYWWRTAPLAQSSPEAQTHIQLTQGHP